MRLIKLCFLFTLLNVSVNAQTVGFNFGFNPAIKNYWGTYNSYFSKGVFYNQHLSNSFSLSSSLNYNEFKLFPAGGAIHLYKIVSLPLQATFSLYGSEVTKWQGKFLIGYSANRVIEMQKLIPDSVEIIPIKYLSRFPLKLTTQFGFEIKHQLSNKINITGGIEYKHFRLSNDNLNMPLLNFYLKAGFDLRKRNVIKTEKQIEDARKNYSQYLQKISPPDLEL